MVTAIDMVGTNLGSGTKTYIVNFCKQLEHLKINKDIYIFICKDSLKEISAIKNNHVKYIKKTNILKNTLLRILWMQFILPFELKFLKVTQLYSPMNIGPIFIKFFKIRFILGLHSNLPWLFFSKMPGNIIRNYITKLLMQFSIYFCDHLIVMSENAKKEIVRILSLDSKKVSSIYLGVDEIYLKNDTKSNVVKNFNYSNYILSVLSCVKYHNIINLLQAFKKINSKKKNNLKFILVMQILDKNYYREIKNFIKKNFSNEEIIILSNLENKSLIDFYKNAKFYIFTSYCEVFGFTTLEAMSQNCPVVVSNKSALPEINQNAAEYFDPDNVNQISEKMMLILLDKNKRDSLTSIGKSHHRKFTWEKTVKETIRVLNI